MSRVDVAPGTIVVYSDLGCPWAHLAVWRLLAARARLGLDGAVVLDHRAFPLELINRRPTPYRTLAAEIPVVGALDPEAGWQVWQADPTTWPVTTLLAMEAVQAAKHESLQASERLDRRLRRALFAESRCISMRHVILEAAEEVDADADALAEALDTGSARHVLFDQFRCAQDGPVRGSPHVFLPDGRDLHNPGIAMEWSGPHGKGFPIVSSDDPRVYDEILTAAAAPAQAAL